MLVDPQHVTSRLNSFWPPTPLDTNKQVLVLATNHILGGTSLRAQLLTHNHHRALQTPGTGRAPELITHH